MINIFEVENLSFAYRNELIFSEVNFTVQKGDFVSIIGANGTGKSTLLKLLLGEISTLSGSIKILDKDVNDFKDWSKVGYLSQVRLQSENFPATVEEIVMTNLYSDIGMFRFPRKEHKGKVQEVLKLVDMADYSKRMIGELSGGQQQRVMLARLLINNPEIIILDEPTNGMDSINISSSYELLSNLNQTRGVTILIVTHDVNKVSNFVSRTLCLEEGSLVELEKSQVLLEISHRHKHPTHNSKGDDGHDGNICL